MYKVNKLGYKWTLNGVAFSCSSARVNHNELRIMFGFLVPSYSPDTSIKLHGVTSQQGKHLTGVSSSDLNHKQTTTPDFFFYFIQTNSCTLFKTYSHLKH